jgi:hypothetical protein
MPYNINKHDFGILRTSGAKVGLMVNRDKSNKLLANSYVVDDEPYLVEQITTSGSGYSSLNPIKEIALIEDDFSAGGGLEFQDGSRAHMYHESFGMDCRFKGSMLPGQAATTVAATQIGNQLVVVDGGLETWSDAATLTSWTFTHSSTSSLVREGTTKEEGTYSAKMITLDSSWTQIAQTVATWNDIYIGSTITVTARLKFSANDVNFSAELSATSNATVTTATADPATTAWQTLTVTHTIPAGANQLIISVKGINVDGADDFSLYVDNIILNCPIAGNVGNFTNFNDKIYYSNGGFLFNSDSATTPVKGFPASITSLTPFGSHLFIGQGADLSTLTNGTGTFTSSPIYMPVGTTTVVCSVNGTCTVVLPSGYYATVTSGTGAVTGSPLSIGSGTSTLTVIAGNFTVAITTSKPYYYMDTTETFTASTVTNNAAQQFAVVGTTLWKSSLPNIINSNSDGTNGGAAWSGATVVDSVSNNITSLLAYDGALNIFKEDRPYYLDSTGAVKIWTDATLPLTTSTSGSLSYNWNGNTYSVHGGNNLLENADGSFQWLSPINYFANASNFCGNIVGITGDNRYLYIAVDDSTKVHVLAGREETNDNGTQWIWHPFSYITLGTCTSIFCSNVTDERIWIGSSNSVYYLDNDITTSSLPSKTFTNSGYMTTPWYHLNFKGDNKAFIKLTLLSEYLGQTVGDIIYSHCYIYYKKLTDTDWTFIDTFISSPTQTAYIPVDGSSVNPVSTYIKFKILLVKEALAFNLPKLHSFDLRAVLYPARRKIHRIIVRAGDGMLDKQGSYLDTPSKEIDATLEEAMNKTYPFTFYDMWGNTKTGKLLPSTPFKQVVAKENQRGFDTLYFLNIEEITTS